MPSAPPQAPPMLSSSDSNGSNGTPSVSIGHVAIPDRTRASTTVVPAPDRRAPSVADCMTDSYAYTRHYHD